MSVCKLCGGAPGSGLDESPLEASNPATAAATIGQVPTRTLRCPQQLQRNGGRGVQNRGSLGMELEVRVRTPFGLARSMPSSPGHP